MTLLWLLEFVLIIEGIPTKNFPCGITPCYATFFLLTARPVCMAGVHKSWAPGCATTTFYTVATNICDSAVWHFFSCHPSRSQTFGKCVHPSSCTASPINTTVQHATEQGDSLQLHQKAYVSSCVFWSFKVLCFEKKLPLKTFAKEKQTIFFSQKSLSKTMCSA